MRSFRKATSVPLTPRRLLAVQTIQHQLPASIHECRLNDLIIGDAHIGLQNERQGQHRRGNRRLSTLGWAIQVRQLLLKRFVEQFMSLLSQKHKQFGFAYLFHNLLFLLAQLDWGLP
jgi:hypothetical protein